MAHSLATRFAHAVFTLPLLAAINTCALEPSTGSSECLQPSLSEPSPLTASSMMQVLRHPLHKSKPRRHRRKRLLSLIAKGRIRGRHVQDLQRSGSEIGRSSPEAEPQKPSQSLIVGSKPKTKPWGEDRAKIEELKAQLADREVYIKELNQAEARLQKEVEELKWEKAQRGEAGQKDELDRSWQPAPDGKPPRLEERTADTKTSLSRTAPCACEAENAGWVPAARRPPKCIFIDLGAADGNTFHRFLDNGYGLVQNCPSSGAYEAILVEANPVFSNVLHEVQRNHSDSVRSFASSAAYMCEGSTSFYLDTVDTSHNFWGSSMSPNAPNVFRSGREVVTVPLINVMRLIVESCLPEDYVLLKMDIEGSEHDIVPCLAQSPAAKLIDALYVEEHPEEWSLAGTEPGSLQTALAALRKRGMNIPEYDTPTTL